MHAKVSGLYPPDGVGDDHRRELVRRWIGVAVEVFGADRLMIGSDFPVSLTAGGYDRVWTELVAEVERCGDDVATAVLGATAASFYRRRR